MTRRQVSLYGSITMLSPLLLLLVIGPVLGWSQEFPARLPKKIESKSSDGESEPSVSLGEIGPVAMIQFVQGEGHQSSPELGKLEFQTLIPIKQTLSMGSSGRMKLFTKEKCIGVLYPHSRVTVLGKFSHPIWKIQGGSFRWICPQGSQQKIYFAGEIYYLEDSEVLFHEGRYLIRGRGVRRQNGNLAPGIYKGQEGMLEEEPSVTSLEQQWKLHQELPVPLESRAFSEPEKVAERRWMLGPLLGTGRYQHQNSTYSVGSYPAHGIRLMSQFRAEERSLILNLDFVEFENPDSKESGCDSSSCYGADISPTAFNKYEMFLAEIGLRFDHIRDWSFFSRIGMGISKFRLNTKIANGEFFWGEYSYYVLSVVGGVDKMWSLTSTFGFVVSAEVRLSRTVALSSSREDEVNSYWNEVSELQNRSGSILSSEFTLFLGPMLEF